MGRDESLMIILIGFPILLGAFGILCSRFNQSAKSFECPNCNEHLALTEIRPEGIQCHRCGWCVERQDIHDATDSAEAMR